MLITASLSACGPGVSERVFLPTLGPAPTKTPTVSPLPTRLPYGPGQLVEYIVQSGDTLPALASHFNSTEKEIREANTGLPEDATTLPPGFPMKISIYYQPLWSSPYKIIPDNLFVNGSSQVGFDTIGFVKKQPGWFKDFVEYAGNDNRRGGEIIDHIATIYSISPRLLLAVLEYQTGALSQIAQPDPMPISPLGFEDVNTRGLYNQLIWAANILNNGYYGWRRGNLTFFEHADTRLERPDPWQNAASVALQYYFSKTMSKEAYEKAVNDQGVALTYRILFGNPWSNTHTEVPGSLNQPAMRLPFQAGQSWAYTGGPHTGWGEGEPFSAIDFAPPSTLTGCQPSDKWVTAVADGVIARSEPAIAVLDLDGDGDERTGWVLFYLHLGTEGAIQKGVKVKTGDPIGHPSCQGGEATGTHVHIARKYNGEWILAGGPLAFDLEGWTVHYGNGAYKGTLQRFSRTVEACVCSDQASQLQSGN